LVFLVLGIFVLSAWLAPALYRAYYMPRVNPSVVRTIAPFAILGFCLSNLFASVGENAIAFTAAEVDFLFPGPFTRRSLLAYKILKTAIGTAFTTLIFSVVLLRYSRSWVACCIGIWLTVQFMQFFAMAAVMLAQTIGERAYSGARRGILVAAAALILIAVAPTLAANLHSKPMDLMVRVHATLAGRILLAPFDVFARTITARPSELPKWAAMALGINLIMLTLVFALDANYLETAALASQRRYERRQRARAGGVARMSEVSSPTFRVIQLPRFGGAGPIAWRQLIGAARSSRALFILLLIIGVIAGTFAMQQRGGTTATLEKLLGTVAWMNIVFISMLKFDFRDELDRLDLLRSLPVRPIAVAAGEIFTPVLVLTAMQAVLLLAIVVSFKSPWQYVLPAAAFAVPFNILQTGIENLLFLLFPLRSAGLIAGDMQLFGRQMIIFLCKFCMLLVALGISAGAGTIGYILGRQSWLAFGVVAWVVLSLVALSTAPILALVFTRFDPSVDTPP
jgi:hypothetical protein